MTTAVKTCPAPPEAPATLPPAWSDASHPSQGEPRLSAPLDLYLTRLLDPGPRVPKLPAAQPVVEPPETVAKPVPAESPWQRAKSSAARTLRAAAPRRQRTAGNARPTAVAAAKPRRPARLRSRTRASAEGNGRQKIMMALIPVLAVALVLLARKPLKVSPVAPVKHSQPAVGAPVARPDIEIAWQIPPLWRPGVRDPMRMPAPPDVAAAIEEDTVAAPPQARVELIVTGVLYSEDRPAAIVNTQLVHEGQQISGVTVKKIERDGIEFEMNGQTWKQGVDKQ